MDTFSAAFTQICRVSLNLWLEAAPWLILGLAAAGIMRALVPAQQIARWLGGRGAWPVVRAAIIGTPLPLCSCSVLPAAITIRRRGASRGATVSFLIATPENGLDSLALSYALLGAGITIARVVGALTGAVIAGLMTDWLGESPETTAPGQLHELPPAITDSVPTVGPTVAVAAAPAELVRANQSLQILTPAAASTAALGPQPSSSASSPVASASSWWSEIPSGLSFAFTKLLGDLIGWLALGVVMAAAVQVFVPANWLAEHGSGAGAKLLMLVVGIPMYICASASTPFAAGLMASGVSPGTALVLLLAGPATNLGSVAIVRRELGTRAVIAYLIGIATSALALGWIVDAWWPGLGTGFREHVHAHAHEGSTAWQVFAWASAVVLALAGLRRLLAQWQAWFPSPTVHSSSIRPVPPAQHSP